jgi:integrase
MAKRDRHELPAWPLTYNNVNQMVRRLRSRTGIDFTVHMLRHSAATEMIRAGVPIEVAARLLTHRSSVTTWPGWVWDWLRI